jgi:hypothetical protein
MNEALNEKIAPETAQALIDQAAASGLSINDYLARLLGLANGHEGEQSRNDLHEETQSPQNEAMLAVLRRSAERLKNMPYSGSTEDSLKILHEGRAGRMYGYDTPD